ncbi:PspA/IM30 family protein [Dictyobacter aurantiacus]|uniref:Phage shock protein A n=1 Tax=Dictyobacter aurantiacus TaxID=1936993 RepID=A0A401ZHJ8_9CHLR|nr:PspA/IM30 family protein [Dictyobacter aurantiacus]GCE06263.1 hypothetical protein KDAU_35920 [Dictyobacter aurantiacus]
MNLLERVLTLLGANLDAVAEKADDPEKSLRQLQIDMRNQLVQVKTEVAKAIAEGHVLQKRIQARKTEVDNWMKKAEQAVQHGNDALARQALMQYNEQNKLVQRYQQQKKEQEQFVATLRGVLRKLDEKIAEADMTIELLATRKRNAMIQQRVYEALQKTGKADLQANRKAREAQLDEQARTLAMADLEKRDLDAQIAALSAEQAIEQQLESLKQKQQASSQPHVRKQRPPSTGPLTASSSSDLSSTRRRIRIQPKNGATPAEDPSTERDMDLDYLKNILEASQNSDM